MAVQFPGLANVYDSVSLEWLIDNHPRVYDELVIAIQQQGGTPEVLKGFTRRWCGPHRNDFALRIEQAARAILASQKSG